MVIFMIQNNTEIEKYIQNIITHQKCNPEIKIEFEIKLLLTGKEISIYSKDEIISITLKLYKHFHTLGTPIETHSINFIDDFGLIKQITYENNEVKSKIFYSKKKVQQPFKFCFKNNETDSVQINSIDSKDNILTDIFPIFKATTNKEIPLIKLNDNGINYSIIRMRRRFTWICQPWQIDFTFTKQLSAKLSIYVLKEQKDIIFKSYIEKLFDIAQVEIEFEYIGELNKLCENDIYQINKLIPKIEFTTKANMYSQAIAFIKQLFPEKIPKSIRDLSIKQLLPQTIELSKLLYYSEVSSNLDNFYLTDKIDGNRVLLFIQENTGWIQSTDNTFHLINNNCQLIDNNKFQSVNDNSANESQTKNKIILDCEMINLQTDSTDSNSNNPTDSNSNNIEFHVFDILYYQDANNTWNLYQCPFTLRLQFLQTHIKQWSHPNLIVKLKQFKLLNNKKLGSAINYYVNNNNNYKKDGLIFTSGLESYQNTKYYKWKPISHMSIDFLAKKCPSELLGIAPYKRKANKILYFLFVGIRQNEYFALNMKKILRYNLMFNVNRKDYFPVQFSPSNMEYAYLFWSDLDTLDNEIVELTWHNNNWDLLRIRTDRKQDYLNEQYFGNNFKVAELIWYNYSNPLTLEKLCLTEDELKVDFYFENSQQSESSQQHKSIRKFNNFVKTKLIERIVKNQKWIVDIGAGRGQDLLKYINCHVENILMVDSNLNNISEIINRKYSYINKHMHTNIRTLHYDVTKFKPIDCKSTLAELNLPNNAEIQTIVCNFAIHYMIWDKKSTNNLCNLFSNLLEKNGRVLIICLDGEMLFNRINNSKCDYGDGQRYSFRKMYESAEFTGCNQKIEVKLPFSDNYYSEYLVNISQLIDTFKKFKIEIETEGYLSDFIKVYNVHLKDHPHLSDYKLDLWDVRYTEITKYLILYKTKTR